MENKREKQRRLNGRLPQTNHENKEKKSPFNAKKRNPIIQ